MASAAPFDGQAVIAKVKTLINAQLKTILKKENLPVSGVKAAMQERIITSSSPPSLSAPSFFEADRLQILSDR